MPKPSGPHRVGSVTFRWTDNKRSETFTANPSDRRQVIAQAWYPTDATRGEAVPYFEAQGHLPSSMGGLPSFMFASFGRVATHATAAEASQFREYNRQYRERFGFPFVICARLNKKEAIAQAFPVRLRNSRQQEMETALQEISKIAELRLQDLVHE